MTTSGLSALRPFSAAELLDRTVRAYRRNFLTYVGIAAVVEIPFRVLSLSQQLLARLAANGAGPAPISLASSGGQLFTLSAGSVLVEVVVMAAMARQISRADLGQTTGVIAAYRQVGRAWWPLFVTLLSAGVSALVLLLWFFLPIVGWATGLGVLTFFLSVVVPLAGLIVMYEDRSGYQALRRGWDLARRRFWPVARFVLILWLFPLVVLIGPEILISSIAQRVLLGPLRLGAPAAQTPVGLLIVESLLGLLVTLLYRPLQAIGKTLLYFDLRVRTEGLDLAWLTQPGSGAAPGFEALQVGAPPAETSGVITGRELGNFVLLSVIYAAGLIALLVGFSITLLVIRGTVRGGP